MAILKWKGPEWRRLSIFIIASVSVLMVAEIIMSIIFYRDPRRLYFLLTLYLVLMVGLFLLVYIVSKEIWYSIRTRIRRPVQSVLPVLLRALTDGGFHFTATKTVHRGSVSFMKHRWEQAVELDHVGLRLHLKAERADTRLYLGPVKKENEEEVAKVKDLVERVAREG